MAGQGCAHVSTNHPFWCSHNSTKTTSMVKTLTLSAIPHKTHVIRVAARVSSTVRVCTHVCRYTGVHLSPKLSFSKTTACDSQILASHVSAIIPRPTCIHVLNPHSIHWAVKYYPLPVRCSVCNCSSDKRRSKAIRPLICQQVVLAVQFSHADAFGVERVCMRDLQ